MRPARGILAPVVVSLVHGCVLATFAATQPKSEPAASNQQPVAMVVPPAPAAATPASVPNCGQGALADPGFSSETGPSP